MRSHFEGVVKSEQGEGGMMERKRRWTRGRGVKVKKTQKRGGGEREKEGTDRKRTKKTKRKSRKKTDQEQDGRGTRRIKGDKARLLGTDRQAIVLGAFVCLFVCLFARFCWSRGWG